MADFLREWFAANQPLIYFVYGLSFFILGMSISLQSRQYSRLNLARSLSWLAGFGLLHGLNEWGDVFIPIQGQFLNEPTVMVLHSIHYIILALSFAFLLQFGLELFRPLPVKVKWLRLAPMVLFITWLTIPYFIGFQVIHDFQRWSGFVTSIARYTLCFPGAILAGLGLLKQAKTQLAGIGFFRISRMLKIAAGALFAYGFFSGLVVNPSFYFPASFLNFDVFTEFLIIPPTIFRSTIGFILLVAIIRTLEVFNIETDRLIRRMEEREVITNERERIARDIHDGALQQVYAAGLMAQSLQKKMPAHQIEMDKLLSMINQAIDQLRAFLPQLRPEPATVKLISALEVVIEEARRSMEVKTFWNAPEPLVLPPEQISHIVAFTSEALSNAIRHSHTDHIEVYFDCKQHELILTICDFGQGLPQNIDEGFGLRNMKDRARLLGANVDFKSNNGGGTRVILTIPMEGFYAEDSSINC
jgi:signal transduction histidine kinase